MQDTLSPGKGDIHATFCAGPLERGRRKKVAPLRPALEQLLGELQGLGRPT